MTDDMASDSYGEDEPPPIGHNSPPSFEQEVREAHREVFLRFDALKISRDKLPAIVNSEEENARVGAFIVEARAVVKAAEGAHKAAKAPLKEKTDTIDGLFLSKGLCGDIENLRRVVQALADDYAARKEKERRRQLEIEADRKRAEEDAAAYEAQALRDAGSHSAAEVATSQSEHTGKAADRIERKAQGSVAQVLRTQHEGVTASGREKWVYEVIDREKIDLNELRDVLYGHELDSWLQRYVDGGGRDLKGVRIFSKVIATFR
jgi:hypothetical protein